jgi:uncharacterized protein
MSQPDLVRANHNSPRPWVYPVALAVFFALWLGYRPLSHYWGLYQTHWPIPLTMLFGSFVAGSTPLGGAAVAFPVFTKLLHISPTESRTFGLMIQAVGMSMASVFIVTRQIRILPGVILWTITGSLVGMTIGTLWLALPASYTRLLYTLVLSIFGLALFVARWVWPCPPQSHLPTYNRKVALLFTITGFLGGLVAAQTGSGVEIATFMVLSLAFGIDERQSIPTAVITMALTSIYGFFLLGVVAADIGVVWNYWLVAAPIVIFGAPLGAYVSSQIDRSVLVAFILFLIASELLTTILFVPLTGQMVAIAGIVVTLVACLVWLMLRYRQRRVAI